MMLDESGILKMLCGVSGNYPASVYYRGPSQVAGTVVKKLPANAGDARHMGSIPGSRRSSEEGSDNPLQYSCLENPMDRRAWRDTVRGIPKTWTRLIMQAHYYRTLGYTKG